MSIFDNLSHINKEFDNLEDIIQINKEKSLKFKTSCKQIYDHVRKIDDTITNNNALPELIINDVDQEQIYQQLQLNNNHDYNSLMKYFSKCLVNASNVSFNIDTSAKSLKNVPIRNGKSKVVKDEITDESSSQDDEDNELGEEEEEEEENLFSDEELNKFDKKKNVNNENEFGIPDGSDSEISDFEVEGGDEGSGEANENEGEESDDVDEDLEELYGDLGDEKEVMELSKKIRDYRDSDEEGSEGVAEVDEAQEQNHPEPEQSQANTKSNKPKDLFEGDTNEIVESDQQKSSFEKRQEKLKSQMEQIHEGMLNNLNKKPWQLKGETSAKTRPQDSLLEEYLEFDHTTRVAPQPSVDSTIKLEDMLKQRIKDKTFDDVERKIKPVEMQYEYKKQVVLDHDKSKQSLSQIYEKEYLNKKEDLLSMGDATTAEKSNPKHDEIKGLLQSLFIKLDALSNFHYTPKAPLPEAKVVSNMPTIRMEEVAPVNVSETNAIAPEEIHGKINSLPKGKTEEDKKDKKKKLKIKKQTNKRVKERKEKLLKLRQALNPNDVQVNKELALDSLKKQSKSASKNIKILKNDKQNKMDTSLKSSGAFFKQLNEKNALGKTAIKRKPIDKQKSSKKLKL